MTAETERHEADGSLGRWIPEGGGASLALRGADVAAAIERIREPLHVVRQLPGGRIGVAFGGRVVVDEGAARGGPHALREQLRWLATLPALYPEWLGDRSFAEVHGVRFPYVAGEMANGIATTAMVSAMARHGMLGFFGAAGLDPARIERAVLELGEAHGRSGPWGINLIHSPTEPAHEARVAELLVTRGVPKISASAFMGLTETVVRCAVAGLTRDPHGRVVRRSQIFAKVSRPEVARHFMAPAPEGILASLVARGWITREEALLAETLPIAEDVTVEADSGGHTDGRPLGVIVPAILALRDALVRKHGFERPIRVGAAGGLGTPASVAAAFALGCAYVMTGSINQAAIESGLSDVGKAMLAKADLADVAIAPAADMFEIGAKVQVLKRGTMFAARAAKLYELYTRAPSLAEIPADVRSRLEREIFGQSLDQARAETLEYWAERDPAEATKAAADPKHEMALVFRSYLGLSSRWAIAGDPSRASDFQIWCGPAMGAFNGWAKGTFLEPLENRSVVQIARNLLEGAATVTRAQQLRSHGVPVPAGAFDFRPRPLE